MSKARIRRVRAERDALRTDVVLLQDDIHQAYEAMDEIRDLTADFDPTTDDPAQYRNRVWEVLHR